MTQNSFPPLENGDCLDRATFHQRYLEAPSEFRAELIDGIVYLKPRVKMKHAERNALIVAWLGNYGMTTPGTIASGSTTLMLDERSEPQPDAILMIDEARA